MTPPTLFRAPAVLVLALTLAACGEGITGLIEAGKAPLLNEGTVATQAIAVEDVVLRVLPGLTEFGKATEIAHALDRINAALTTRVPAQVSRAADLLRVALDSYAALLSDDAVRADLDAVFLLYEDVQLVTLNSIPQTR